MTNLPLKSEQTDASEITAVGDYLEQLPLHLWGPEQPLLDLLRHNLFGWVKSSEQIWEKTTIQECTRYASHLAELASPQNLRFLESMFELKQEMEMAGYEKTMSVYKNLTLVALVGFLALSWYESNTIEFGYLTIQVGVGGITVFIFVALLSVFAAYSTNASSRATNCYRRCAYLLSLAQRKSKSRPMN